MVASHDGRYLAEQLAGNASSNPSTLIRDLQGGNVVGQLAGIIVTRFSWDGSLVAGAIQTPGAIPGAEVIRWQTHKVIWSQCTCPAPDSLAVLAQPGGTKLAVIASGGQGTNWSFTIVDADGSTKSVSLAGTPVTPAF
jgi:hypothetical protein